LFAIIDIETCGGKFSYPSGRITEICVLVHDGSEVIEKFSSLVDPECFITPLYTEITGITNQMVKGAPKFREIAQRILSLTDNKTFVAHNVSFDYNFIKAEFAHIGLHYERKKLCTVQLSRKLISGKRSYSLGVLCDSLGISNKARHRAEGDALATAELFNILLEMKPAGTPVLF
jgi:DNA polymerase-3 subunit epsilon